MYVQASFDHVKVFMKAEGRKANSVRWDLLSFLISHSDCVMRAATKDYFQYQLICPLKCQKMLPKAQGDILAIRV